MTRHVIFLDLETNGLDPRVHDAWEVSWWSLHTDLRDTFLPYLEYGVREFMRNAQLPALRVNRFVDRWTEEYRAERGYSANRTGASLLALYGVITESADETAVMACASPKFDLPFVSKMFAAHDLEPEPWHRRAIDLASYACGALGLDPADPPSAATVAEYLGIERGHHTAESDVTSGGLCLRALQEIAQTKISGMTNATV